MIGKISKSTLPANKHSPWKMAIVIWEMTLSFLRGPICLFSDDITSFLGGFIRNPKGRKWFVNPIMETESVLCHKKSEKWGTIFLSCLWIWWFNPWPWKNISIDILHKSEVFLIVPGFHHFFKFRWNTILESFWNLLVIFGDCEGVGWSLESWLVFDWQGRYTYNEPQSA